MMDPRLASVVFASSLSVTACSSGGSASLPTQLANGAPIVFMEAKFTPLTEGWLKIRVRGYNFADKGISSACVAVQCTDRAGKLLRPFAAGSLFENDDASHCTPESKGRILCEPRSWCEFEFPMSFDSLGIAKAEAALTQAMSLIKGPDTYTVEVELWRSAKGLRHWPL